MPPPSLGGLRLLLGEFLGIDDHSVLAGEREEILHPLPADADIAGGREGDERLQQRGAVDRLVAERGNHFGQSELDELDLVGLDSPEFERFPELGGAGDAFAHDGELAALQILEVPDGAGEVAANDDGGKAESLGDLALVRHQLHDDAARERVEQSGRDRRAADLHLAGRDRGQNLGRGLEADDLDVQPFVVEVPLLLRDEDAGIGDRADGADLERHARIERRGLRRRGRGCDRERSRQARGERGGGETKTHRNSPWYGRRCGRQG
jgi:hypothetical protein